MNEWEGLCLGFSFLNWSLFGMFLMVARPMHKKKYIYSIIVAIFYFTSQKKPAKLYFSFLHTNTHILCEYALCICVCARACTRSRAHCIYVGIYI